MGERACMRIIKPSGVRVLYYTFIMLCACNDDDARNI